MYVQFVMLTYRGHSRDSSRRRGLDDALDIICSKQVYESDDVPDMRTDDFLFDHCELDVDVPLLRLQLITSPDSSENINSTRSTLRIKTNSPRYWYPTCTPLSCPVWTEARECVCRRVRNPGLVFKSYLILL